MIKVEKVGKSFPSCQKLQLSAGTKPLSDNLVVGQSLIESS